MNIIETYKWENEPHLLFKKIVFEKIQKAHVEVYNYEMFRGLIFKNVSVNRKYKMLTLDEWSKHLNVLLIKLFL